MKKHLSSTILFVAAMIWGLAFVAQKDASSVPAFTLTFLRSVVAGIFLIPIIMIFDKLTKSGRRLFSKAGIGINKKELLSGFISALFLTVATVLQQFGIKGTDAGKASFITALYVVIVPVYACFFGKKPPLNTWIAVGGAVVGFFLLCIKDGFVINVGDLLVLACAFAFAMQIMAIDLLLPGCDGIRLSAVQFFTVSAFALILALIFERGQDVTAIGKAVGDILYLGICSSGIAYTLQIIGQKNTHPAIASIILSLESVFGAIASAIILKERMTAREYIGCAVVLVAVIISQLDFSKKPTTSERE